MENKTLAETYAHKALLLGFGIFVFWLSSMYVNKAGMVRLTVTYFPQIAIVSLFGFFHALNAYNFRTSIRHEGVTGVSLVLDLLGLFFVYSAFYNVVLLPYSGLAVLEWVILALVLFGDFFSELLGRKVSAAFIGQNPMMLLFLGIIFCIIKFLIFFFFDSSNIYDVYVRGNATLRTLMTVFVAVVMVMGIVLLLNQLKTLVANRSPAVGKGAVGIWHKIGGFFKSLGRFIANAATTLLSAHVLMIVLCVVLLIAAVVLMFLQHQIFTDILAAIEPLLEKFTTGENSVVASTLYGMAQVGALILVTGYQVVSYIMLGKTLDLQVAHKVEAAVKALPDLSSAERLRLNDMVLESIMQKDNSQKITLAQGNRILHLVESIESGMALGGADTVAGPGENTPVVVADPKRTV